MICEAFLGELNLITSMNRIFLIILILSISISNFTYFLAQFFKDKNLAYEMSNFLILLPNLIVLMVTGFDKGKNLGFIAFLFPGSGLLGIILNEKNDL